MGDGGFGYINFIFKYGYPYSDEDPESILSF